MLFKNRLVKAKRHYCRELMRLINEMVRTRRKETMKRLMVLDIRLGKLNLCKFAYSSDLTNKLFKNRL